MGRVGRDREGALVALGDGARALSDRDAREGSCEEEGQMHVEVSSSDVVEKRVLRSVLARRFWLKKNDRFRERRNER